MSPTHLQPEHDDTCRFIAPGPRHGFLDPECCGRCRQLSRMVPKYRKPTPLRLLITNRKGSP